MSFEKPPTVIDPTVTDTVMDEAFDEAATGSDLTLERTETSRWDHGSDSGNFNSGGWESSGDRPSSLDRSVPDSSLPTSTDLSAPVAAEALSDVALSPMLQLPWDHLKTAGHHYQPARLDFTLPKIVGAAAADYAGAIAPIVALLHRYAQPESVGLTLYLPDGNTLSQSTVQVAVTATTSSQQLIGQLSETLDPAETAIDSALLSNVFLTLLSPDRDLTGAGVIETPQHPPVSPDPDLHWFLAPSAAQWQGTLMYDASLFQASTIERMVGHLAMLVQGMQAEGDRPISTLSMLTPAEVEQQIGEWSSPTVAYPQVPIFHAIEAHAVQQPGAIALRFKQQSLTYGELNERANQLAHYLMARGVEPGVRVSTCFEPSLEVMVAFLAIFKAGGTYVPLDPNHPPDRLTTILEETQPPILLTLSTLVPLLPSIAPPILSLDHDWEKVADQPTHNPNLTLDLGQTAYIIYTSGTTGKPKGVMASHANLVNYIWSAQETYGFSASEVMPAMARFTFSITMFELWSPLVAGGQLVLLERDHVLDLKRMVQTLQEITFIHISPSLLRRLVAHIQEQGIETHTFRNLRHVSSGGDMVSADLLAQMRVVFPQSEIFVIYGCSEISCMGCTYPVPMQPPITKSRVGKPFQNVTVRLYDGHQNLVPVGMVGEICFSGGGIAQGYLNRDDLTQTKFVEMDGQRFYGTGDLGRFDQDGNLEILGRSDFQIKLRGIRIEPGEIEVTLRQAPGVRDAVVAAPELRAGDKSLIGYLVLDAEQTPELIAEIRQFLQAKLPDYMVPAGFMILEALPLNVNGKVDRKALPIPTFQDLAGAKPFVAPRTETEKRLSEIWESVLGISPIGVQDSFFDIGGDSLQSIALMEAIDAAFGRTLPLSTLLTESTIEDMAAVLAQSKASDIHESLVVLKKGGSKPPIFFVHDGEGETLLYRNLALNLDPAHPVYGLQPYSRDGFPILHTRLAEIAEYYTAKIQSVQPTGPYYLSGLCIGGFLAFEVARLLVRQGETVAMVALIDTADVKAELTPGLVMGNRLGRFSQALEEIKQKPLYQRVLPLMLLVLQKVINVIRYEITSRLEVLRSKSQMRLLRFYLDRKWSLPGFLRNISVRVALKFAEKEYVPEASYQGDVLLFLATKKSSIFDGTLIDDTPYTELYSDPLLGWRERADQVLVYPVSGGHSSMLQEPNVQQLAKLMQTYIDRPIQD